MGETRVDLHHLLEDLRDAYPGALEETILPEVVSRARSAYVGFNSGSYRQALVTPLRKLSGTLLVQAPIQRVARQAP